MKGCSLDDSYVKLAPNDAGRVDLHSHVLPGVDDGARTVGDSLAMLRAAAADGTTTIVATPHASRVTGSQVMLAVEQLNAAATIEELPISVVSGSEVRFDADLVERHRRGELITIGRTPYLLLELSLRAEWSPFLTRNVFDLQMAGLWPILAHAERYPAIQRDPTKLIELVEAGMLVQVNADALSGTAGRSARRTAEQLLSRHLVHVIASDSHDLEARPPLLAAAYRRIGDLVDRDYAALLAAVPHTVIAGATVKVPEPIDPTNASLLARLKGKLSPQR